MDPFAYRAPGLIATVRRPGGPTHVVQSQFFLTHEVTAACGSTLKKDKGALVENRARDEVSCLRCDKAVSK